MELDELLDEISVVYVDKYTNEVNNGGIPGLVGWYGVCNEQGIVAYFAQESSAFYFRLALINSRMNKIGI